jgi:hypothetical protein
VPKPTPDARPTSRGSERPSIDGRCDVVRHGEHRAPLDAHGLWRGRHFRGRVREAAARGKKREDDQRGGDERGDDRD